MTRVVAVGAVLMLAVACSHATSSGQKGAGCSPPPGGRCAGPQPISVPLTVDRTGRMLLGNFPCGGSLTARESSSEVSLTYHAAAVRAGGLTCALVPLSVSLSQPLGHRRVVDATTGATVLVHAGR